MDKRGFADIFKKERLLSFRPEKPEQILPYYCSDTGVTLILSFFFEPKGITMNELRAFAIWSIVVGLFIWILRTIFADIAEYWQGLMEDLRLSEYEAEECLTALAWIWWFINIIAVVCWVVFVLFAVDTASV